MTAVAASALLLFPPLWFWGNNGAPAAGKIAATSGISLLLVVGAVAGTMLLRDAPKNVLAALLSFGAAALPYLVTEELLVETRVGEETLLSTAMFFLGFLAIFASVLFGGTADPLKAGGLQRGALLLSPVLIPGGFDSRRLHQLSEWNRLRVGVPATMRTPPRPQSAR